MGKLFLFTMAIAAGATAAAGESPRHSATKSPNDMICRDTPLTGSRIDVKRVCMTRLQWDEQRRNARDDIDRAQRQQTNPTG